jgi:hypothetical protein
MTRALLHLLICAFSAGAISAQTPLAVVVGHVHTGRDRRPVDQVVVTIGADRNHSALTSDTGAYAISVSPGVYDLTAERIGFKAYIQKLTIVSTDTLIVDIRLEPAPIEMDELTVTPGDYSIWGSDVSDIDVKRRYTNALPLSTQDIFQALGRLPGVSANDFSARFSVRGGDQNEVLVLLDGLELREPFHLRDLGGGVLSIIDSRTLGSVRLMTGGFSAQYGDHQSGVLEMRTKPVDPTQLISVSAGLFQAGAKIETGNERISAMASSRFGYHENVIGKFSPGQGINPSFWDGHAKLSIRANERHTIDLQGLIASDDLTLTELDADRFQSRYATGHIWLNWKYVPSERTILTTTIHGSEGVAKRIGSVFAGGALSGFVDDLRNTIDGGAKFDLQSKKDHHRIRAGAEVKRQLTDFYYFKQLRASAGSRHEIEDFQISTTGTEFGAFISDTWQPSPRVSTEIGLRYDAHSHTSDQSISPRATVAAKIGKALTARAAWGRYHQTHRIEDLYVQDNDPVYRSDSHATHYIAGLEYAPRDGIVARLEAYHKALDGIHNRYENVADGNDLVPEVRSDRISIYPESGKAQGVELLLRKDTSGWVNWWLSYALSRVDESHSDQIGYTPLLGASVPRRFDQTHSISIDVIFYPRNNWSLAVSWQGRSGWPYTPLRFDQTQGLQFGEFLSDTYPFYHTLDLKISHWYSSGNFEWNFGLGISNVLDRQNVRKYTYDVIGSSLFQFAEPGLPSLPFFEVAAGF